MLCNESCQSVCVPLHTGMMLKENNTLKKLDLMNCRLQPEVLEEVIKGVKDNTKLETLHLTDNIIDAKRALCLGKNACTGRFSIICEEYCRGRGSVLCMAHVGVVMSVHLEVEQSINCVHLLQCAICTKRKTG